MTLLGNTSFFAGVQRLPQHAQRVSYFLHCSVAHLLHNIFSPATLQGYAGIVQQPSFVQNVRWALISFFNQREKIRSL